jgi:hypothetical protein
MVVNSKVVLRERVLQPVYDHMVGKRVNGSSSFKITETCSFIVTGHHRLHASISSSQVSSRPPSKNILKLPVFVPLVD